jgi:hypothetical protein
MENLPSAKDFIQSKMKTPASKYFTLEEMEMVAKEFAKLHVEAALNSASNNALVHQKCNHYQYGKLMWEDKSDEIYVTVRNDDSYDEHHSMSVDSDSIINAYPLTNIK